MKNIFIYLLIICVILLLFVTKCNPIKREVLIKKDTLYQVKYDTIEIVKQGRIEYLKDTILLTKPFVSKIDTTIDSDYFAVSYSFPENNFDFRLETSDTIETQIIEKYETKQSNLIIIIISFIIGLLLGIL